MLVAVFPGRAGQHLVPRLLVAKSTCGGDNRSMAKGSPRKNAGSVTPRTVSIPFLPGAMVVVTLGNPRDKFWGMILALAPEGLSLTGIELASFEDLVVMVKDGESFSPAVVFFPMHRIERIELDLPDGSLPSLSQRFSAKTGLDPAAALGSCGVDGTIGYQTESAKRAVRATREPA